MTQDRLSLGKKGEAHAEVYLKNEGYKIKEKNFRCPLGEIDIIALDGGTLVFVEVKTRSSSSFGYPFEAVNKKKQRQILKTAKYYILKKRIKNTPLRIDVVSILIKGESIEAEIIKNAFEAD